MTPEELAKHEELHKKIQELDAMRPAEPQLWNIPGLETYFVKDGWLNGVEGERALTCGFGVQQKDGWYYMLPDMEDGVGPYVTEELAKVAAVDYVVEKAMEQND